MSVPRRLFHCDHCGKWSYGTRKDAKRVMRNAHPGAKGLEAYRCPTWLDVWHYGHSYRRARKWVRATALP